ncbi:MAG: serine/threonine protein kinase [Labilithrix sp.]|nr:serine/threonine protein kinase [Labilithrix sp.]
MTTPPSVIGGRYRVIREIGRGAAGVVYEAEHQTTGERVALKVMSAGAGDLDLLERLRRDARACSQIQSEHVAKIIDADPAPEAEGNPYLVMELLLGADLKKLLADKGRMPPAEALAYLQQAARGVERGHAAGIVHRDLKPENLFVHTTPEGRRIVKVLDFGVEHAGGSRYRAPEQIRGDAEAIGTHTDVWALGMIAVELLTGASYWSSEKAELAAQIQAGATTPPHERWPFLPQAFDLWFMRSCAKNPLERWRSVKEQIEALAMILSGEPDASRRSDPGAAPSRRSVPPPSSDAAPAPVASVAAEADASDAPPYLICAAVLAVVLASGAMSTALLLGRTGVPVAAPADASTEIPSAPSTLALPTPAAPATASASATASAHTPAIEDAGIPPASASTDVKADAGSSDAKDAKDPAAKPDPGYLTINSAPPARVSERGRVLCTATPCAKLPLSPGSHAITLENKEEGLKNVIVVNITSGEVTSRRVTLKAP